jgi:hypothetical protein
VLLCVISSFYREVAAVCWVIAPGVMGSSYRRFGTTYRYNFQEVNCPNKSVRIYNYSLRSNQKSAVIIFILLDNLKIFGI